MKGVMIGEKHSYTDWDLYLGKETSISFPKIKETVVDIPGADNEIDLTEALTGDVKYKTRDIKLVFYTVKKKKNWRSFISEIANYLHGKRLNIIFDDDPSYFYVGRCQIDPLKLDEKVGKITIDVKAEAYKYSITSTTDDWPWDTFNFETLVQVKNNNCPCNCATSPTVLQVLNGDTNVTDAHINIKVTKLR